MEFHNLGLNKKFLVFCCIGLFLLGSVAFAEQAVIIATDSPGYVAFGLAKLAFLSGDYQNSVTLYQKAIAFNPEFYQAYHNLGVAYSRLQNAELAIVNFQQAIHLNNNYAQAHYSLALLFFDLNRYEEATAAITQAAQLEPNAHVLFDAGVMFVDQYRYGSGSLADMETGLAYYRQVLAIDSEFPHAASNAAIVAAVLDAETNQAKE